MKYKLILAQLLVASWMALAPACSAAVTERPAMEGQPGEEAAGKTPSAASGDEEEASGDDSGPNIAGDYLSSQFARNSGNIDIAIASLQRVYDDDPDNTDVAMQLLGLLLVEGRIPEAIEISQDMESDEVQDPLAILLLALREIKAGNAGSAEAILSQGEGSEPPQLWMPLVKAWVAIDHHTMDKPLMLADMGTDIGRAAPLVNYHLALINSAAGFREEAAKDFRNAIQDPKDPPQRVMRQLLRFYDKDDAPEALAPLVKEYRTGHPALDNDGTTPVIANAKDGVAEILYTMGGIMYGAGVANDAAIYLQLAVYLKPGLAEATVALGDTFGQMQLFKRANDMYAQVQPQDALYAKAQLHIAVNEERMGKYKEAIARLERLIRQSTAAVEALVTKGDLLRIHGHYAEAVDAYTLAIHRIPQMESMYWPLLFARGSCYEREGKWPEAEKDLKAALELKPDQPDVLNYLGFGWLERGEHIDEAKQMITKAVRARPDDAQIVDSMGWALYMEGDYSGSSAYLEKAVELLPGDPTVNDHLGDVYWRLGRHDEARFQWQRALTFTPDARLTQAIQRKLRDGLPPTTNLATSAQASATP